MVNENFQNIQKMFLQELIDASNGKNTSLPFIVHAISARPLVKEGEIFQVLVIGGSVFKKALLKKDNGKLIILSKEEKQQPRFSTKEEFLSFIETELDPTTKILALNFAYPLTPTFDGTKLDGVLLSGSKENHFEGLVGERVGDEIQNYIYYKKGKKITVASANDTICLLLSGLTKYSWKNLAAGIVGTGMNFAFFLDTNKIVNLESANFDKFPQSEEGKEIDSKSIHKGKALFEKEVSGAYLYKHFNFRTVKENFPYKPITSTKDLDLIMKNYTDASKIAKDILERSASLIACQIGGIAEFKKHDLPAGRQDMVFVMEGSLFWNSPGYRENVEKTLKEICKDYTVNFVKIDDSTILGAAKLVS